MDKTRRISGWDPSEYRARQTSRGNKDISYSGGTPSPPPLRDHPHPHAHPHRDRHPPSFLLRVVLLPSFVGILVVVMILVGVRSNNTRKSGLTCKPILLSLTRHHRQTRTIPQRPHEVKTHHILIMSSRMPFKPLSKF